MVYSIYFSPTGGTEKVVETLASVWESHEKIDLTPLKAKSNKEFKEDVCLIAVPSYGGRVPAVAVERISKLKEIMQKQLQLLYMVIEITKILC